MYVYKYINVNKYIYIYIYTYIYIYLFYVYLNVICAYVRAKSDNSIIPKLFLRVFHLCTHEDQFPKGIQITCEEQQQLLGDEIAAHGMGPSRASQFFPHRFSSVRTATHNH